MRRLITAENIGRSYYSLLHRHIDDAVVRSICGKLVSDEVKHLDIHIEFFRERLTGLDPARIWLLQ